MLAFLPDGLRKAGVGSPLLSVTITGVTFGVLYALLASCLVLTGSERMRFLWSPLRNLRDRRKD